MFARVPSGQILTIEQRNRFSPAWSPDSPQAWGSVAVPCPLITVRSIECPGQMSADERALEYQVGLAVFLFFRRYKVSWPAVITTRGNGRAFPPRPTICALSWPPCSEISIQDAYSRSGALRVKSQRPKNDLPAAGGFADLAHCGQTAVPNITAIAIRNGFR